MKLRGHHKFNTIEFNSNVISGKTPFKGNNNINSFLSSPRKITTQLGHEHALIQLTLYCKHCGLQKSVCPFPCSLEFCQYLQSFLCTLTCFFFFLFQNLTIIFTWKVKLKNPIEPANLNSQGKQNRVRV